MGMPLDVDFAGAAALAPDFAASFDASFEASLAGAAAVVEADFTTSGVGEALAEAICARTAEAGTRQRAQSRAAFLKVFIVFSGGLKGRGATVVCRHRATFSLVSPLPDLRRDERHRRASIFKPTTGS
jgi:hypothetical protein